MTPRDEGVSLVEVLVGMGLFAVLSTLLLGMALSTSKVTEDTRQISELNEESQLTMERITRELRQASAVNTLHVSTDSADPTVIEFMVDFDGTDGTDGTDSPVTVTYSWNPGNEVLSIRQGAQSGTLATSVTNFGIVVGSTLWQYDTNRDGETTWQELDTHGPPVGNQDSVLNGVPDGELAHIDHVEISMTISVGTHVQTYVTKVDLRNVDPNQ